MTTTSEPTVSCPPSAVHDMIVTWAEVREGDLVLHDGQLETVHAAYIHVMPRCDEQVHVEFDGVTGPLGSVPFFFEPDALTAVRRYVTGDAVTELAPAIISADEIWAMIARDRRRYDTGEDR